jgi:hypothetical protein
MVQGAKAALEKEGISNVTHLFHLAFSGARPPFCACMLCWLSTCNWFLQCEAVRKLCIAHR